MDKTQYSRWVVWALALSLWCMAATASLAGWGSGDDGGDGAGEEVDDPVVWSGLPAEQIPHDKDDLDRTRDLVYERTLSAAEKAEIDSWQPDDKNWWFDDARDESAFRAYHRLRALAETETGTLDKLNYLDYDETLGIRIESVVLEDGKSVDNLVIDARLRPDLLWRSKLVYIFTNAMVAERWDLFLSAYLGYPINPDGFGYRFVDLDELADILLGTSLSWLKEAEQVGAGDPRESAKTFIRSMLEELYPERLAGPDVITAQNEILAYQGALQNFAGNDLASEMKRVNGLYLMQDYHKKRNQADAFLDRLGVVESEHFFNILMRLVGPRLFEIIPIKPRAEVADFIENAELQFRGRRVSLPRNPSNPQPGGIWSISSVSATTIAVTNLAVDVVGHVFDNRDTGVKNPAIIIFKGESSTGDYDSGDPEFWMRTEIDFVPDSARAFMGPLMGVNSSLKASIRFDGDDKEILTGGSTCLGEQDCLVSINQDLVHEAYEEGKYVGLVEGTWSGRPVALPFSFTLITETSDEYEVSVDGSDTNGVLTVTSTVTASPSHTIGESVTFGLDASLFYIAGAHFISAHGLVECEVIDSDGNKVSSSCECVENNSCPDTGGIRILDDLDCPDAEPGSFDYCACWSNINSSECMECGDVEPAVGVFVPCSNSPGGFCPCSTNPNGCQVDSGVEDSVRLCESKFPWVAGTDDVVCALNNASCDGGLPSDMAWTKTIPAGAQPELLKACSNGLAWGPCADQPVGLPVLSPEIDPAEGFPACHCVGGVPLFPGCSCGVFEQKPDLTVDWIGFTNESASVGDALQINLSIRNVGTAVAPAAAMLVELETPNGVEDIETHSGSLAPGESRVFEYSFDASVAGLHRARVELDTQNELLELSETNNSGYSADLQVGSAGGGFGVDLAVSPLFTTPDNPTDQTTTEIEFELKNLGSYTATGVGYLVRMLGPNHAWEARGTVAAIDAGERHPLMIELPLVAPGVYSLAVVADPDDLQMESNEENNQQGKMLTVNDSGLPCLPCTSGAPANQLGDEICFPPSPDSWYGDRFRCTGVRPDGSTCSPDGTAPNGWHHIGSACPMPLTLPAGLHPDACGNPGVCPGALLF